MKTRNRPLEIVFRLREFSVEVSCLLTGRYRLVSQSTASHVVFEDDLWGEAVAEFSHSLGQERTSIAKKTSKAFQKAHFPEFPESLVCEFR